MKFDTSTAQTHANDLLPILNAQVMEKLLKKNFMAPFNGWGSTASRLRIAFIKVDNGPDWSLLNVTNELYFTRLWKDSGQDVLGIVSYALRSGQHTTTWNTYRVPRVKK